MHYAEPPPFLCKDTNFEANYNRTLRATKLRHGVFDISKKVKGECRKQIYLHYAEPSPFLCKDANFEANYNRGLPLVIYPPGVFDISKKVKGECRKQIYLHYAEPPPFLCKDTNFEANYNGNLDGIKDDRLYSIFQRKLKVSAESKFICIMPKRLLSYVKILIS